MATAAIIESGWYQWSRSDESLWYVFDDRQMYRPGETARIKGWVRRLTVSGDAQLAAVASDATITYQANDWYGNEIGTGTVDVNALGGFDFDIDIPAGANLGQAWINLTLNRAGFAGQLRAHDRDPGVPATRVRGHDPSRVGGPLHRR